MGGLGRGIFQIIAIAVLDGDRCFCSLGYEAEVWGWESGEIVRIF